MHDRPMSRITADCGETIHNILGLLGTQSRQLVGRTDLCHLLSGCQLLLQPTVELRQGDTIFHHRIAITLYLRGVLHALQMVGGGDPLHNHAALGNSVIECHVRLAHIDKYPFAGRQMRQVVIHP